MEWLIFMIKNLINKAKHFINYLYYIKLSFTKNTYPCKYLGEYFSTDYSDLHIKFRILGTKNHFNLKLKELFSDIKLIGAFHPIDAFEIGSLAFKDIILSLPFAERKQTYNEIKKTMLNTQENCFYFFNKIETHLLDKYNFTLNNNYPCKLVNLFENQHKKIMILYTLFGKRDGYKMLLFDLVHDNILLSKFHPADAIKLGFVSLGEKTFTV